MNRREAIKRTALFLGAAVSSSTIAGCLDVDRGKLESGAQWKPQFLNQAQAKALNAATEFILPRTDTPGALDVGVPPFIDLLYGKYLDEEEKTLLANGLNQFDASGFAGKTQEEQAAFLKTFANTDPTAAKKLRELTLTGYFTSEEVCKNVTHYDPIPGQYRGCVPISETGNVVMSEPR